MDQICHTLNPPGTHFAVYLFIYYWSDETNSSEVNEGCLCLAAAAADCLTVMNFIQHRLVKSWIAL